MADKKRKSRPPLPDFGVKGRVGKRGAMVRAWIAKGKIHVQWPEPDNPRTHASWPDSSENRAIARAFAEGVAERLRARLLGKPDAEKPTYEPLTLRQLWQAYELAEWEGLRPRTRANYLARWTKLELYKGRDFLAASLSREHLDEWRKVLRKAGHAPNQIARHIEQVKRVYRWAIDRDLIPPTKLATYRFKRSRDERPLEVPEYKPAEAQRLLAQFDPRSSTAWRSYVALYLFAFAGPRQNAARHLRWDDVDFAAATVHWRPEYDKLGKDRVQPLPQPVIEALWVAYGWRLAFGYEGPWILFRPGAGTRDRGNGGYVSARTLRRAAAKPDKPWSYSAFNGQLVAAERRAKVPHVRYRAAHGFRRYVVNEVLARTGNLVLAGKFIGDDDVRTLQRSYVRARPEELRHVAQQLEQERSVGTAEGVSEAQAGTESGENRNENATAVPAGTAKEELTS